MPPPETLGGAPAIITVILSVVFHGSGRVSLHRQETPRVPETNNSRSEGLHTSEPKLGAGRTQSHGKQPPGEVSSWDEVPFSARTGAFLVSTGLPIHLACPVFACCKPLNSPGLTQGMNHKQRSPRPASTHQAHSGPVLSPPPSTEARGRGRGGGRRPSSPNAQCSLLPAGRTQQLWPFTASMVSVLNSDPGK